MRNLQKPLLLALVSLWPLLTLTELSWPERSHSHTLIFPKPHPRPATMGTGGPSSCPPATAHRKPSPPERG